MKLCKLKLKNLNSFRDEIELNFEKSPLDDASLVAITGPTGAGKTTLLDAICVALYGKTPRLSGTGSQHPSHLVSHGEKEGFAEVHFIANGTPYLATWSIRRGSSPRVQLSYAKDGKLISDKLSSKGKSLGLSENTVSEEVESILGLDFDAFRRSVMLAQGEFAAFLKANNEERRTILEATAGISIYDVLKQTLNDKVGEVEAVNAVVVDELNKIPAASREQVAEAEAELDALQAETGRLVAESRQIQQERDQETKRTEEFERFQSSEKRQEELLGQQPEIDALQTEQANANCAQRLLPEKQVFDNTKSALAEAKGALHVATAEKTEAKEQVKSDQAAFDKKAAAYSAASTERDQKMRVYAAAKSDVERAAERFAEVDKRMPELVDVSDQIDVLESQLVDRQTKQARLQGLIDDALRFLENNPLPSDRQHRLNRATGLLAQLESQEKQLETALASKAQFEKNMSSLKQEIKKLSDTHTEHISEKAEAETTLKNATAQLNKLLATGTYEEWTARTRQAAKAQPIAQKYEATRDDLADAENQLNTLNDTAATLETELEKIKTDLANQTEICQRAAKAVQDCEMKRESVLLANPINQLRQHLHTGEPCLVCGATEHPHAGIVEAEGEERFQRAEAALAAAKNDVDAAQAHLQTLKTKQIQTEQDKRNTAGQIETCTAEIETLRDETAGLLTEWQVIYPDADVSSKWASERFTEADTAITAIGDAEKVHTQASHAYQIATQHLKTCENDIKRETNVLNASEKQFDDLSDTIEDLQADVASTETRFWESMPDTFHDIAPAAAVKQFGDKIEEVEKREGERDNAKTQLQVLNVNIEADQGKLQDLKNDREELKTEMDKYRCEAEAFLDAAREKTDGLETEDEINKAIDALETDLQTNEDERDEAEQQLQSCRDLLTQTQTAHAIGEKQFKESSEKFETARQTYFDKLAEVGFDSPEAHDDAFRDEAQLQKLTDQIDAHKNEIQQLALEITELQTRFEETPFDPEALERIEIQLGEIEAQLQAKQKEIGAQGERIKGLKDALEKREALADKLRVAQQELERWQRLQETIPRNDLRDFALEIMFKQMGSLANEQLKYLTSERYQLKVEGIGDLSVIDRWNANEERPVETLSGGESFLTSLALALALSELSRGRSQLNSLFLDEGFGTLDTETLDIAIAALEGLRMQGRSIFLISHIQELTRRLPVKINVRKQGNGSSSVDIRG